MDFLCEDTFELLPRLEKEGHPYDFIILDPPAFTKARRTVENAMRGYKEINYRAMKLLPRGGYLATASCSHFATEELFIKMLRSAAKDAHRQLRQIEVPPAGPRPPHPLGRAGDELSEVFPVSGDLKPLPLGEVALRSNDGEGKPGMTDPPHSDNQTPFVRAALSQRPCFPVRILALSGAHAPALPRGEPLQ